MRELLLSLGDENYLSCANEIQKILKPQIQKDGIVSQIKRKLFNEKRKSELDALERDFLIKKSCVDLDERIDALSSQMYKINKNVNDQFQFDPLKLMGEFSEWDEKLSDLAFSVDNLLNGKINNEVVKRRLSNIISKLVNESISQSNKVLAGIAGEQLAHAIFASAGLLKDTHYKAQHTSEVGSKTDYVMPCVPDYIDDDVQIYLAVQYSSNDRARMVNSELKKSANQVFITGNGLTGSTKNLKDIGKAILASHAENRFRLVCYGPEIEKEKSRLKNEIAKDNKLKKQNILKLEHVSKAKSFEQFAIELKKRFLPN